MEFSTAEGIYYGACFAIGFVAGLARIVRDHEYQSCVRSFSAAANTGSITFASVAILASYYPDHMSDPWLGLGLSALLGAVSKEQDKILRAALQIGWRMVAKRVGMSQEEIAPLLKNAAERASEETKD